MSEDAIYNLEELAEHPGTYFNPQTEVVVIVDDSASHQPGQKTALPVNAGVRKETNCHRFGISEVWKTP